MGKWINVLNSLKVNGNSLLLLDYALVFDV